MGAASSSCVESSLDFNDAKHLDRTLLLEIIDSDDFDDANHDRIITITTAPRVKAIHIDSSILSARSPFFCNLFYNGMLESDQKHVTLRIKTLEEESFMDLLKYVSSNTLPTTLNDLLNLCVIADKFLVDSCMRDCIRSLQTFPMTFELASLYLDPPQSLLMLSTNQPLINAAKKFLGARFKDSDKFEDERLNLSLVCIQAVLPSEDLIVDSECDVYHFVLKWARKHYPVLEERRGILKTHLLHLVRFPLMRRTTLAEVQICRDIDPEVASDIVMHALRFKAEHPNHGTPQVLDLAYRIRPVKVVEVEVPYLRSTVYLDLTREDVTTCFPPLDIIVSKGFSLGRHRLSLIALRKRNHHCFYLGVHNMRYTNCIVEYEVAVRKKPYKDFQCCVRGDLNFSLSGSVRYLHNVPWSDFVEDDSCYFIKNVLHVRAEFAIRELI